MLRKFIGLTLMASMLTSTVLYHTEAMAAVLTMQKVYNYAQAGKTKELLAYIQYGYSIDVKDDDGKTALCYAIEQGNAAAVKRLISLGANRKSECVSEFSDEELKKVGLVRRYANQAGTHYKSKDSSGIIPAVWKTNTAIGLAIAGGVIAIIAASGGGGGGGGGGGTGGGSTPKDDETTTLDEVTTIDAIIHEEYCPIGSGMVLKNGVCTCPDTKILVNGVCVDKTDENTPTIYVTNGGTAENTGTINPTISSSSPVVAMQSNGVSASALSEDGKLVYLDKASSVKNTSTGTIEMVETSATNGGVIGMFATAAGTINNDGSISIVSKSDKESAAMKAERDDASGITGLGKNITNNGTISIKDEGNGSGTLSGIAAPGRNVTNNGKVVMELETTGGLDPLVEHGTIQGLYGRSVVNKGTIDFVTDTTSTAINSDAYMIRGAGDQGTTVANDGTVNIDLTKVAYGIRGVWSDETNGTGATIKNTGKINVTGALYNQSSIDKQVFLLGSEGGIAATSNFGKIQVGKPLDPDDETKQPIDVSLGGIIDAMYGFSGSLTNKNNIDFHLKADPETASNVFSASAMYLQTGTILNDSDIAYSYTNEKEGEKVPVPSDVGIKLSAIHIGSGTATNNQNLTATLKGNAGSATDSYYTAISAGSATITNNKKITADSNMDNVDLIGLKSANGKILNSEEAKITLTTTGDNADLYGGISDLASSEDDGGENRGLVYLVHNQGSGNISGFDGANYGTIKIEANDMTGTSRISGGQVWAAVSEEAEEAEEEEEESEEESEESEEEEEEEEETDIAGKINIALEGRTAGDVYGFEYMGTPGIAPKYKSANTINISANSEDRQGDLSITGIYAQTEGRTKRDDDIVSVSRDGVLTINATGSEDYGTKVIGMYAEDANITNVHESVINLNVDLNGSTDHYIAGMELVDSEIVPYPSENTTLYGGYRAQNDGTLNIDVKGTTATSSYERSDVPFDVVGMVTNSFAINNGTINLNVESETAKTAGMVAYDGGIIANQGTIEFTGTAANFTPMYATGRHHLYEVDEPDDEDKGESWTKTIYDTDYYATLYNSGTIIINNKETVLTPKGEGWAATYYYDPDKKVLRLIEDDDTADDVWAKNGTVDTYSCSASTGCTLTKHVEFDTRGNFTAFDTIPVAAAAAAAATPPKTLAVNMTSNTSEFEENTAENTNVQAQLESTENVMDSVNNTLAENVNVETTTPTQTKSTYTMTLNDGMKYVSEAGGSVVANGIHLLGSVTAGTSLVLGDNKDTFVATGSGSGAVVSDGDASDLRLDSNSAMFNASYAKNSTNENGLDIVMTRKNFNEIVQNDSLASFLENNYQAGNNIAFFDKLKAFSSVSGLTDSLNKMTGAGILSRFNFEDMTMMRELNFNMNEQLFHNKEGSFSVAGLVAPMAFKGDLGSKSKYSLFNKRSGNMSIGLGIAFSDVKSDDEHKDSGRHESVYQMIVPIGFKMLGFNLMTSPRIGYARGKYDREGFDSMTYNGTVEKRVYGLMNEARYPIAFGDWTLEPAAEFNVLGYTQKGKEDAKDYSLNIKSQNTYSIESGIGLYFLKDKDIGKDRHLKFNAGVSVYHEFADPYKINVGMRGMDGSFQLRDEERSDNRGVLRLGLDYENKDYTIYGSFMSYIDKEVRSNFKSGVKVKF